MRIIALERDNRYNSIVSLFCLSVLSYYYRDTLILVNYLLELPNNKQLEASERAQRQQKYLILVN
jgi:hypothetical protein